MLALGRFCKYLVFRVRKAAPILASLLILLPIGCQRSDSDFQHLTSMHISGGVYDCFSVSDEGVVIFVEHEWRYDDPHVGPAWCTPTLHRMYPDGRVESKELPTLRETSPTLTVEGNLVTPENGNKVTYIDLSTFSTITIEDSRLAELAKEKPAEEKLFFDSGFVVYLIGRPEHRTGVGVYNPATQEDTNSFWGEHYDANLMSVWGDCVIALAADLMHPWPSGIRSFIYLITLDGEQTHNFSLPGSYLIEEIEAMSDGLIVSGYANYSYFKGDLAVERYSFEGNKEVSYPLPDIESGDGCAARIKIIPGEKGSVVVATQPSSEDLVEPKDIRGCAYIGYFDAETGEEIHSRSNDKEAVTFYPLKKVGHYYMHPSARDWKVSSGGEIALFDYERKIASMHFNGELDRFAASPNGKFFAIASGGKVSLYTFK